MAKRAGWPKCTRALTTGAFTLMIATFSSNTGCIDRPLAEAHPQTTNLVVTQLQRDVPSKIDLLFMIDNSQSMADKQSLLAQAVPALLKRLISPRCVDPESGALAGGHHPCAQGVPEFMPVEDIHVGVITSSIGGHGGSICSPAWAEWNSTQDDAAHLVGERRNLASDGLGFLSWNPKSGSSDVDAFVQSFASHVQAAGETGCGYEAQLEAWYRFLVDPEPPASITMKDGVVNVEGVDSVVLQQRAEFLRPDSLVAVVMLSDENDCSIVDAGQSFIVADSSGTMYRATAICDANPDSPCCRSCGSIESEPPAGCAPIAQDPGCTPMFHDAASDDPNLRCFAQKRRFGVDFLQPVQRYVDALTKKQIVDRHGNVVPNPLLAQRDPSFVYLAGIVGVPWQDVASPESLKDPALLRYLSARELSDQQRWSWLLPHDGAPPDDALMIESTLPRSGTNPALGVPLVAPGPTLDNPINGHEWSPGGRDLQYSCIYPLSSPRDCSTVPASQGCDCRNVTASDPLSNPLCQDPATGEASTLQRFAKAYPATRQLQVLRGVGESGIVSSICPKITDDSDSPSYGYTPAVDAIVDRLKEKLVTRCMPRPLEVAPDGSAQCAVVEALPMSCSCDAATNRSVPAPTLATAVKKQLRDAGRCGPGSATGQPCEELCLCEIGAATDQTSCQNEATPSGIGWCYVDPDRGMGNAALVKDCPSTERRLVRFAGQDTPRPGASVYVACMGAPL